MRRRIAEIAARKSGVSVIRANAARPLGAAPATAALKRAMRHRPGRHEAAVAPPADAEPVRIGDPARPSMTSTGPCGAADHDLRDAGLIVVEHDAWQSGDIVAEAVGVGLGELIAGHRADRRRHILDPLASLGRGDDDVVGIAGHRRPRRRTAVARGRVYRARPAGEPADHARVGSGLGARRPGSTRRRASPHRSVSCATRPARQSTA